MQTRELNTILEVSLLSCQWGQECRHGELPLEASENVILKNSEDIWLAVTVV
jgi:hypothetical protein